MNLQTNRTFTTYDGGTVWFSPSFEASADADNTVRRGAGESFSVWSYRFGESSYPVTFYSPDLINHGSLPPNHPTWDQVDAVLGKIWAEGAYVDPKTDDDWLDDFRASWGDSLEALHDESDTRQ